MGQPQLLLIMRIIPATLAMFAVIGLSFYAGRVSMEEQQQREIIERLYWHQRICGVDNPNCDP